MLEKILEIEREQGEEVKESIYKQRNVSLDW